MWFKLRQLVTDYCFIDLICNIYWTYISVVICFLASVQFLNACLTLLVRFNCSLTDLCVACVLAFVVLHIPSVIYGFVWAYFAWPVDVVWLFKCSDSKLLLCVMVNYEHMFVLAVVLFLWCLFVFCWIAIASYFLRGFFCCLCDGVLLCLAAILGLQEILMYWAYCTLAVTVVSMGKHNVWQSWQTSSIVWKLALLFPFSNSSFHMCYLSPVWPFKLLSLLQFRSYSTVYPCPRVLYAGY